MSGGLPSGDETVLPGTVLDDVAAAPTRLDAPPGAATRSRPAAPGDPDPEGATILGTLLVAADATVFVDDRVASFETDERAATVLDSAEAATLLDPNAPARRTPRPAPTTGEATATPASSSGGPVSGTDAGGGAAVPPPNVRYVLETIAGKGGMGTVHVARDVELLRKVALKELSHEVAHDRSARSRFVREVQVTAQLDHPHIVPVYSLEVASGGRPAYAMKLVEGQTLGQLIADTRAAYERKERPDDDHALPARLEHFLKVCDAIAYAHERGVVHRDLKPANLMIGRHNEVYVMDWGICRLMTQPAEPPPSPSPADGRTAATANPAKTGSITRAAVSLEASHGETAYGAIVGTPLYMAPEQAQGRHDQLDAKSDQCALGLILFELVALKRALGGKALAEVLTQASAGTRAPLVHAFGDPIPGELAAIVGKASAAAPADRYASVADLADDLRRFLRGDAVLARPDSAWQRAVRSIGRHRQTAALALLGLIIASLAGAAALLWRQERALETQSRRDRQIERLVADVGKQGDRLQVMLLELHDALDMAVGAIGHAYEYGRPGTGALLWNGDTRDLTIGFETAPGVPRAQVEAEARRVMTVGASVSRVIASVREHMGTRSGAQGRVDAAETGLHELRAGFESGLKFTVPAAALHSAGPDVRQAGWYKAAWDGQDYHWALVDHDGDADKELALSAPIVGDHGKRLGAAGLVIALDHALANLVRTHPVRNAKVTLLLAHDGTLLASLAASGGVGGGSGLMKLLRPEDLAEVVRSDVGFVETDRLGPPHLLAYDTIQPFGWTIVTIADTADVVGER